MSNTTEDIAEILKVTKIKPKKICVYTSTNWKQEIYRKAIKLSDESKFNMGDLIKEIMSDPKMKKVAKEASQFAGKLSKEVMKLNENDKKRYRTEIDEKEYLENAKDYFEKVFSCKIEIYKADDKKIYDPANKNRFAIPLRPAIYIE